MKKSLWKEKVIKSGEKEIQRISAGEDEKLITLEVTEFQNELIIIGLELVQQKLNILKRNTEKKNLIDI